MASILKESFFLTILRSTGEKGKKPKFVGYTQITYEDVLHLAKSFGELREKLYPHAAFDRKLAHKVRDQELIDRARKFITALDVYNDPRIGSSPWFPQEGDRSIVLAEIYAAKLLESFYSTQTA